MNSKTRRKKQANMMSLVVPLGTRLHLDYLAELYENYRPQVPEFRAAKVNRSHVVRMAIAHLYDSAQCGLVGPELLRKVGQDRRAGRLSPRRR